MKLKTVVKRNTISASQHAFDVFIYVRGQTRWWSMAGRVMVWHWPALVVRRAHDCVKCTLKIGNLSVIFKFLSFEFLSLKLVGTSQQQVWGFNVSILVAFHTDCTAAIVPAFLVFILIFVETEITESVSLLIFFSFCCHALILSLLYTDYCWQKSHVAYAKALAIIGI
jgi:hypothetical protein